MGLDLSEEVDREVVELIKQDVRERRILVFRDQQQVTPERHLAIGGWFGEVRFYRQIK